MNVFDSDLFFHFKMLALQIPELLTLIVSCVLCIVFMKRHPKAALLAFFGFLLLLVLVLMVEVMFYLLSQAPGGGWFDWFNDMIVLGRSIFAAGAYALIVAAVFVGRTATVQNDKTPG